MLAEKAGVSPAHRALTLQRVGPRTQGSATAPLQRVVEYGQAAAAKATEQAQAAYECGPTRCRVVLDLSAGAMRLWLAL